MDGSIILAFVLGALVSGGIALLLLARRAKERAAALHATGEQLEALRRDLAVAGALAKTTEERIARSAAEREEIERELERVRTEQAARIDALSAERAKSEQELAAAQTALSERQRQLGERIEELHAVRDALDNERAQADVFQQRIGDEQAQRAKLEQRTNDYAQKEAEIVELRRQVADREVAVADKARLVAILEEQLEGEKRIAHERQKTLEAAQAQQEETIKGIAAQVMQQTTEKFEENTKVRLTDLLQPLTERMKEYETRVQDAHKRDIEDRGKLHAQLQHMVETTKSVGQDTVNLTRALKGSPQMQGAWGEITLERILESSGMREGIEFERQTSFTDDDGGRLRPDVIVRLPGGRSVVLDSKVSLVAYTEYVSAVDDDTAGDAMRRHMAAVRAQIKNLADKEYWRINTLDTGDYVLMFLPIESAFADTIRQDGSLFEEAFRQNVVLTSPSTLLATLRTIEHSWRVERQNESARAIVELAGKLYDKFCGFVEEMDKVGARLRQAQESYDGARRKLIDGKGNLVRQADQLRGLGIKSRKALPKVVEGAVVDAAADDGATAAELSSTHRLDGDAANAA